MGLDLVPQAPNHAAPTELIGCFGNVAINMALLVELV